MQEELSIPCTEVRLSLHLNAELLIALPTSLTEEEIATIIGESVKGLEYLHKNNLIHRDIKSGNLLLTSDGRLKLADFGVSAQLTSENHYRAKSFIGTPYWVNSIVHVWS